MNAFITKSAKLTISVPSLLRNRFTEISETLSNLVPENGATSRGVALFKAIRLLLNVGAVDLAAALGFFTVMSLLPLVALIIMTLITFGSVEGTAEVLAESLDYLFPASHNLIDNAIDNLLGGSLTIGLIAVINLIIGANGLFAAANRATNRVFGIDNTKVIQVTIKNVSVVTILVALFLSSVGLTSVIQTLVRLSQGISPTSQELSVVAVIALGTLSTILPAMFTTAVFAVIYFRLPNSPVKWRDAFFGAIVAIILFEIGKHLFFWFNNHAADRSSVYGPITSVVVLMLWAYIASLIFLYGAALTKVAGDLRPK